MEQVDNVNGSIIYEETQDKTVRRKVLGFIYMMPGRAENKFWYNAPMGKFKDRASMITRLVRTENGNPKGTEIVCTLEGDIDGLYDDEKTAIKLIFGEHAKSSPGICTTKTAWAEWDYIYDPEVDPEPDSLDHPEHFMNEVLTFREIIKRFEADPIGMVTDPSTPATECIVMTTKDAHLDHDYMDDWDTDEDTDW